MSSKLKLIISGGMWKFAEKVAKVWGLPKWEGINDPDDVLLFGMYSDNDYEVLRNLKVNKSIFWCGSDITQMLHNWDRKRIIKMFPEIKHYTETEQEAEELRQVSDNVEVAPSFLEPVESFDVCFKPSKTPHIYLSGHPNREEEYGFDLCKEIAEEHPEFTFHFYGVEGKNTHNVIYHGWVSNDQFNKEIRDFQCGLRCNEHDGASEIVFKSLLMGQYPISFLHYEKVWQFKDKETLVELLKKVAEQTEPNIEARNHWLPMFNSYPWMEKGNDEYWKERDVDDFTPDLPHRKDLYDEIVKFEPQSVLEIGCGCGSNLAVIQKYLSGIKIAGIDLSAKSIEKAVKNLGNIQLVVGDGGKLPFEDKSFDVVFTDGTLIYVRPDKIEQIRDEMLRVARKGIVMVEFHHNSFGKLGKIGLNHWVRNYKELFEGKEVELKKITNRDSWKWQALAYLMTVKLT